MLGAILFLVMVGEVPLALDTDENSLAALDRMVKWAASGLDISSIAAAAAENTGSTMLHEAVVHEHTKAVQALVAAGASLEAKMAGLNEAGVMITLTPLQMAVGTGNVEVLRALIAAGASTDVTSYNRLTLLHLAARTGEASSIEVLLESGASHMSLDGDGNTPLHLAAMNGKVEAIGVLVAAGAPLDAFNHAWESPLYVAVSEGHMEAVRALRAASATSWNNPAGPFVLTGDDRPRDCCGVSIPPPTCFDQNA